MVATFTPHRDDRLAFRILAGLAVLLGHFYNFLSTCHVPGTLYP